MSWMLRRGWTATVCAVIAIGCAASAAAQDPERPLEGVVGFQYLHGSQGGFSSSFPFGFYLELSRDIQKQEKRSLSLVGGLDWGRSSDEFETDHLMHFSVGARLKFIRPNFEPFVEGRVGFARLGISQSGSFGFDYSESGLGVSAGGGVKVPLKNGKGAVQIRGGVGRDSLESGGFGSGYIGIGYCPFCGAPSDSSDSSS